MRLQRGCGADFRASVVFALCREEHPADGGVRHLPTGTGICGGICYCSCCHTGSDRVTDQLGAPAAQFAVSRSVGDALVQRSTMTAKSAL